MAELQQRQEREMQEMLVKEQPSSQSEMPPLLPFQQALPQSGVQTLPLTGVVVKTESRRLLSRLAVSCGRFLRYNWASG